MRRLISGLTSPFDNFAIVVHNEGSGIRIHSGYTNKESILANATEKHTSNDWKLETVNGLELIFSPLLAQQEGLTHAFTTRKGGTSRAPFDSFNLGGHIRDDEFKQDAISNRKKLLGSLSLKFEKIVVAGQVHSRNVTVIKDPQQVPNVSGVDGLTTNCPDVTLMLHFADCVPVIVFDRRKRIAAIFHAGWKGTAARISGHGVETMAAEFGSNPADMVAAVGPAIGSCCYQTGEDVALALSQTVADVDGLIKQIDGKPYPDLKSINAQQLFEAGVGIVEVSNHCTACNPEMFYSHRQSGGITGRQGALICLTA